ncbi:UNVERIFIED_CONTAM: hypothetical protein Sangu_2789800 [Sesamum angustifolium]|uniref:Uncharacterized protein n=1 Tax=Sesamum angustifolium TaxID=2727405 RepID=A0AAW2IS58_9LAMI
MCMSPEYMFLTMVILGHLNPKRLIDVYLESLIEELQNLWHVGVLTRDSAKDNTFTMRPTLMWTVDDLPAYGIAFGWSSDSVMGCLVYMVYICVFYLQNGRKACYFDCHKQFLPPVHPYCRNKKAFTKNQVKRKIAHSRLREKDRDWVKEFSPAVEVPLSLPNGYGIEHKWTKKSILWELKYWLTHLIDTSLMSWST